MILPLSMAFLPALRKLFTHLVSADVSGRSGSEPGIGPSSMSRNGARIGSSRYGRMRLHDKDGAVPVPSTLGEAIPCSDGIVDGCAAASCANAEPAPERKATMSHAVRR